MGAKVRKTWLFFFIFLLARVRGCNENPFEVIGKRLQCTARRVKLV